MLISYEPAFLFIHIDKVAGSSITLALQSYGIRRPSSRLRRRLTWLGPVNRLCGLYRALEFSAHAPARTAKRCLPPAWYSAAFKFAFVRNPWDRLVSRYAYVLRNKKHHKHGLVGQLKSFEDYLAWEIRRSKLFQHSFVTDARGRWIVDFIGYYERLHEDFARVCKRLEVRAELPRANISDHRDYRTYYTPAARDLVAEHFRRDIELFGYDFDGLPADSRPVGLSAAA